MGTNDTNLLLVDANVLIDYVKSDLSILELAGRHLGEVYVLSSILDEVDGLDSEACTRLGLRIWEPEFGQLEAAANKRAGLSFQDHLCLVIAAQHGMVCVTNDGALRTACTEERIPVRWGLELMLGLVRLGQLSVEEAIAVAQAIHRTNPFHINKEVVRAFEAKVRSLA